MTRSGLIVAPLALLLAACGSNAELRAAGATSGAGGATAASASSAGSSSGVGGAACAGYIDLAVDDGAPQHLASCCAGEWNPQMSPQAIGYLIQGGVVPFVDGGPSLDGPRLEMFGCASAAPGSEGVELLAYDVTAPGNFTIGLVRYTDAGGQSWGVMSDPFVLDVTQLGVVGDFIEGTVTATVSQGGNAAHAIEGSFHVCRAPDEIVP